MIGVISSFYNTLSVGLALIITMSIVIGLTFFACQTKFDFTGIGPYLCCALIALLVFGIMNAILCANSCQILNTIYSLIGALIFSMYIVYDTQMICGGNHKYQFNPDDYIFAALSLYIDIINLFLYILSLFKRVEGD
jgi:FtsH-binding integral membrane protein